MKITCTWNFLDNTPESIAEKAIELVKTLNSYGANHVVMHNDVHIYVVVERKHARLVPEKFMGETLKIEIVKCLRTTAIRIRNDAANG